MGNLTGKIRQFFAVRLVRPAGKLPGDGVLCHGAHTSRNGKTGGFGGILQLYQSILKGAVAIYCHQNRPCTVSLNLGQPLDGHRRHPSAIGGGGDHRHISGIEMYTAKIKGAVGEIHRNHRVRQGLGHCQGGFAGTSGGAETDFVHLHKQFLLAALPARGASAAGCENDSTPSNPCKLRRIALQYYWM